MTTPTIDRDRLELALHEAQVMNTRHQGTQVYRVTNAEKGQIQQVLAGNAMSELLDENLAPYPRTLRGHVTSNPEVALIETAGGYASTPNFPDLLRSGIAFDAFSSYNGVPVTWPMFVNSTPSNKQQEEYLKDSAIGILPVVGEGEDYPNLALNLHEGVTITNHKHGGSVPVTEEMRRFDQVGKVRQIAQDLGRAARITEEYQVYVALTTSSNYDATATGNDNNVGDNTAATTFSATGLITAFTTLTTMKDRKSGTFLGVMPNTLIVDPYTWFAAKQLIQSPQVMRAHSDADSTVVTVERYGTGTDNAFFGLVDTIIVSPWMNAYNWVLMERGRALRFQRVDPVRVLPPEYYPENDTWKYFVRTWFGVGMLDDRFAYLSTSSTAPTVT